MPDLPTGTVTFLFTDLEGSTRLWEAHPDAMQGALARHDEILRDAITAHDGHVVKTTGDGVHAAFATAGDAVSAAVAAQRALAREPWGEAGPLRVRMGLHTGPSEHRDSDYFGTAVNRAARLMSAAHGGQIVVSLATEELLRDAMPEGCALVDLGEHRLRDLSRAERAFQLAAPGLAPDFPSLRSLDTYEGNLPPQLTSFIGRDDELRAIAKLFDETRLITVTGVGGVGKTRLAIQLAADLLPGYPDGAWFCELAAAADDDTMAQVVAVTLEVQARAGMSLQESIVDYLRTKRLLLVLDNCEHLIDAAGILTTAILRECRGVRLVATSREGLAVEGEQVWPLHSLPIADLSSDPADLARSDAVQLFVERARSARPGFTLDQTTAGAIAEICRRLDGIPLAIELAAARVVGMRPTEIAALLDERFRLLTGGRRASVERHQTLRATVEWSYTLLAPGEQVVFDRLGVFVGPFAAAAAEAVVSDGDLDEWAVREALSSLVAKSMVNDEAGPDGTTHYQMLETLRHFALERLDAADDGDRWRRRHGEHYTRRAEVIGPALESPDELAWRPRFLAELDNLRAAVIWSLDAPDDADSVVALRIVAALAGEAAQCQSAGVGIWAERATGRLGSASPDLRFAVLGAAAWRAFQVADFEGAKARARDALRDLPTPACPAPEWAFIALALSETLTSPISGRGHQVIIEAGRTLDTLGAGPEPKSHLHAAGVTSARDDAANVRAEADLAVRYAREAGNPTCLAVSLYAWGLSRREDEHDAALAAVDESIALTRAGASNGVFGYALALAARLHAEQHDDPTVVVDLLREAMAFSADLGDRPMVMTTCAHAFEILGHLGHHEEAAVFIGITTRGPMSFFSILNPSEPAIERTKAQLDAEVYNREVARGASMTFDEIVDFTPTALDLVVIRQADG